MITIWINVLFRFLTSKQLMSFDLIWCDFIGKLEEVCLLFQAYWMIQYDDDYKPLRSKGKGKEEGMEEGREAKRNGWCSAHCLVVMCNVIMTIHFHPFPNILRWRDLHFLFLLIPRQRCTYAYICSSDVLRCQILHFTSSFMLSLLRRENSVVPVDLCVVHSL